MESFGGQDYIIVFDDEHKKVIGKTILTVHRTYNGYNFIRTGKKDQFDILIEDDAWYSRFLQSQYRLMRQTEDSLICVLNLPRHINYINFTNNDFSETKGTIDTIFNDAVQFDGFHVKGNSNSKEIDTTFFNDIYIWNEDSFKFHQIKN